MVEPGRVRVIQPLMDCEFGPGSSVFVERTINRILALIREKGSDAYTLQSLEIASRILLGKPLITDQERDVVLEELGLEWNNCLPINNTPENNYFAVLTSSEHYLLTGEHKASEKVLKKLKEGAEKEAIKRYEMIFGDLFQANEPNDLFYENNIEEVAQIGLVAKYLDLDSFNDKMKRIIEFLEFYTKNFFPKLRSSNVTDSIDRLKIMADQFVISA